MMKSILFSMALLLATTVSPAAFAQENAVAPTTEAAPVAEPAPVTEPPTAVAQSAENFVSIIDVPTAPTADGTAVASAPPAAAPQNSLLSTMEREINDRLAYLQPKVDVNKMPSLFFNVWEHDLVLNARRGLTTGMGDEGIADAGDRDIALGGIVYVSGGDWTIWLNNTRVTPKAIPAQIMDLKVYKEHIDLEWFDASTNQIFPIRLRSHQRFNLDTRIFLPG